MTEYYHLNNGFNLLDSLDTDLAKNKISNFLSEALRKKDNLSLLIGSGCSSGCIPLMGNTIQELRTKDATIDDCINQYLMKKLGKASPSEIPESINSDFSDIENLLNWLQMGSQYLGDSDNKDIISTLNLIKGGFIKTVPTVGATAYSSNEKLCRDDVHSHAMNLYNIFYRKLFSFRTNHDPKISIFTINYDLYNEYAMENNNIHYTTGISSGLNRVFDINNFHYRMVDDTNRYKDKWQPTSKSANLYKIHGSINWKFNEEKNRVEETLDSPTATTTAIYPTAMKHRETAHHPYSELFREFSIQLQRPNSTLIIMGYGFPDDHINNIISQNIVNEDFNLIIFGNKEESKCKDFFEAHKDKPNIHLIGGEFPGERSKINYFDSIISFIIENQTYDDNQADII